MLNVTKPIRGFKIYSLLRSHCKHNPTDYVASHRLGLFAPITASRNPNLAFHNGNTKYVLGGLKNVNKILGVSDIKKLLSGRGSEQ